jgi:endonuclease/exonuclease/phosphatase family metal-dependent hydrolase
MAPATFAVVLAHWRANMGDVDDAAARRSRAAHALCTAIARRTEDISPKPHVLVLGDLNTEPFSNELRSDLPTSRSRDVVRNHSRRAGTDDLLLYNPCWRLLGERSPWRGEMVHSLAGTFTMKKNSPSTWRTFDQVLVSGSLLGTRGWVLREDELTIGTDDEVFDPKNVNFLPLSIDHFPVLGQLQWIENTDDAR